MRVQKILLLLSPAILLIVISLGARITLARVPDDHEPAQHEIELATIEPVERQDSSDPAALPSTQAACTGGTAPSVPGPVTLDLCYQRNLVVGGNPRIIRVWYITNTTVYTVDSKVYNHWISGESQAEDVADAVEESWQTVFTHSAIGGNTAHEPYINGCGSTLNIQMEDGKGWLGIAYWGSSGNCNIGIDSPMVLDGVGTGDDGVIFHEVQHYTQYDYDAGCYADFQALYSSGNAWIEGWANLAGKNAANAANDANYSVASYNSNNSYYDLSYTDLHAQYLIEQYGGNGAPSDPEYGIKAVYEHYRQCDLLNDIFVMDETIQSLTGGAKTEKWAFVDFEAAYYAYPYADAGTQPELVFPDADDKPTGTPAFAQNVNMSGGTQNWVESSPEDWTGKYYRINPQSGCEFIELHVETQPLGGEVGINFLAVNTGTPSVLRSAHIGDNATRFYAGFPANSQIVINVTSFDSVMTYQVSATCVSPTLNILEPKQNPGHAMVGAPTSPIAFLTRFEVSSSGLPISGIISTSISLNAEGDPVTMVGEMLEIGPGEYWVATLPPTKPGSTTFVDYQVCLNTSFCDTETDSLLYIDPGNSDNVLLFDESGSMSTVDTPGEPSRVEQARRAGSIIPDLLRDDDRIAVLGFGGADIPAGCGLPPDGGGVGNCDDATITRMARTDVVVPGTIVTAQAAVAAVVDRPLWTNLGQGLINAKDVLLANPGNTNPDRITLLSDGRENVHPLYNSTDVKDKLDQAGVCVDTIGLGPEAPGALLAQIAADNCGDYYPVPTSGLGTSSLPKGLSVDEVASLVASQRSAAISDIRTQVEALGLPTELGDQITIASAPFLPGQLGLANVYDSIDTQAQDAARVFHANYLAVPDNTWKENSMQVDKSAQVLRFVVAGKQFDSSNCSGYHRDVEVLPPGPTERWIPISPPDKTLPAGWDVRNSPYDDTAIIPPAEGLWKIHTRYRFVVCVTDTDQIDQAATSGAIGPQALETDFMQNGSVQSTIRLQGRLLDLADGQGLAGDTIPIIGNLMTKNGLLPGAFMVAAIENEDGTDVVLLLDDGMHHDGGANDGIYGWDYSMTSPGGSYSVRIVALFSDPANAATLLLREWNGGFWIKGPQEEDEDKDGMPDPWEERCKLDTSRDDSQEDPDGDGLSNITELGIGTSPCQPDTDRGGEMDGSEVNGGRNPLWAADDKVRSVGHVQILGLNNRLWLNWSVYTDTMHVYVSTQKGQLGNMIDLGRTGSFTVTQLPTGGEFVNGTPYYLTFSRFNSSDDAQGAYSDQHEVIPKEDPIPPQGAFLIGGTNVISDGDVTISKQVMLLIDATDIPSYEGPASHSIPHNLINPQFADLYQVSGNIEMRFSNDLSTLDQVAWEPLADEMPWTLECQGGEICTVYGQFKDGADNESLVIDQRITLRHWEIYLPIVLRNQ